jgi:hypothetical protein
MEKRRTLGAFHQTYYKRKSFDFSFQKFRSNFPDSPYLILSDNGEDFSEYENENTFFIKSEIRNYGGGPSAEIIFKDPKSDHIWIDWYSRIKKACEICGTDYLIMMEDDVYIKEGFEINFDFDLCGPIVNKLSDFTIRFIENKIGKKISGYYGFSGGSILNCKTYIENYDQIIHNFINFHKDYSNNYRDPISLAGDANTMIQFYLIGKEYSHSPWIGNQIIHPYKEYYSAEELPNNR